MVRKPGKRDAVRPGTTGPPASRKPVARDARIPVVGVGSSAGGLDALQCFIRTIPARSGIAYVVVQHLDSSGADDLPALLSRDTRVPVVLAEDGDTVQPDRVYIIPPDRVLTLDKDRLRLARAGDPCGPRLPMDTLFHSMAQHAAERTVGVVLSGNGSDGSLGLRAIRAAGGLAIAQQPATADDASAVRSARAAGLVDHVLPVPQMIRVIRRFVDHPHVRNRAADSARPGDHFDAILSFMHARWNVDFSGYRKDTLIRRITRRMGLCQVARPPEYLKRLRDQPEEVNALFSDLLIQVTRFFREPESWEVLRRDVLPRLVEEAASEAPIRAWVPGCATGEEAYSIAMLLLELREQSRRNFPIQVFASDLDPGALEVARLGAYPESIAADVSPERLQRFFTGNDHHYQVNQHLRDILVFGRQDVLADPPFSRLDLISCRNLLIYLEPATQQRVLERFHFGLKPGRFLFLGNGETVGPQSDLFQPVTRKARIYRRQASDRVDRRHRAAAAPSPDSALLAHAREVVLERLTTPCVLINRRLEILALFGPTSRYLTQPTGRLTADLLSWVRETMRSRLRVAIQTALRRNEPTTVSGIRIRRGTAQVSVACTVEPISSAPQTDGLLLVAFQDEAPPPSLKRKPGRPAEEGRIRQLEQELRLAREEFQSSVEQLERSSEELRAANQEVLSMNEELQSANQELEASREELQSVNQELVAVNARLEGRLAELQDLNEDIANLLASTDLPLIFLDRRLLIRRFTPAMQRLFRLIPTDIGRPLADITGTVEDPDLLSDAERVLERLAPIEREVRSGDGQLFVRKVLPCRTGDNRIQGVVITFADASRRHAADREVQESRDFAEAVVETMMEPLLIVDEGLVVRGANSRFYETFRANPPEVLGVRLTDLGFGDWNVPELRHLLQAIQASDRPDPGTVVLRRQFKTIGERVIRVNVRALERDGQRLVALAMEDVSGEVAAEEARNDMLRQMVIWEEKERHRLALELHDEAGQHVTAFLLGLAALKSSHTDPASATVIEQLQQLADELARSLHGLSLQLRPMALDEHGLVRALQSYLEDLAQRHHLEVDFQSSGAEGRLPSHLETVLYRVTQEAVTNVLKHAEARKVSVVLDLRRNQARLAIEDDGKGFDPDRVATPSGHLGLRGIRERVTLVGGQVIVESEPGKGTTVFVTIPLRGG